jgi:hypothetical protein
MKIDAILRQKSSAELKIENGEQNFRSGKENSCRKSDPETNFRHIYRHFCLLLFEFPIVEPQGQARGITVRNSAEN